MTSRETEVLSAYLQMLLWKKQSVLRWNWLVRLRHPIGVTAHNFYLTDHQKLIWKLPVSSQTSNFTQQTYGIHQLSVSLEFDIFSRWVILQYKLTEKIIYFLTDTYMFSTPTKQRVLLDISYPWLQSTFWTPYRISFISPEIKTWVEWRWQKQKQQWNVADRKYCWTKAYRNVHSSRHNKR